MTRWSLLFLVFALGALPVGSAQSTSLATFTSAGMAWHDGSSTPLGGLVALQNILPADTNGLAPTEAVPIEDSFFSIQANAVTLRIHSADAYVESPAAALATPPPIGPADSPSVHWNESTYHGAQFIGTESQAGREAYVFPLPACPAIVQAPAASAMASVDSDAKSNSRFDNRFDLQQDTSNAIEVRPDQGSAVTVTGCFRVVLWQWNGEWSADEGSGTFWSGKRNSQGASDPTGTSGVGATVSSAQQLYIQVQDGTFTIHGNDKRPTRAFLNSVEVEAATLTLGGADGQVTTGGASLPLHAQTLQLHGQLDATLTRSGSQLASNIRGQLDAVNADGRNVELASTVASSGSPSWAWLALGVVGIVAVPVLVRVVRRPARRSRHSQLEALEDESERLFVAGSFVQMREVARHLAQVAPRRAESHLRLARALDGLQRFEEAEACRERAHELASHSGNVALVAENALQAVCAAVRHGREDRARLWAARMEAADPGMQYEISGVPELAPVLDYLPARVK